MPVILARKSRRLSAVDANLLAPRAAEWSGAGIETVDAISDALAPATIPLDPSNGLEPATGWSDSRRDDQMVDTEIFSGRFDALESYLGRLRSLGEAAESFSGRLLRMVRLHLVPSLM